MAHFVRWEIEGIYLGEDYVDHFRVVSPMTNQSLKTHLEDRSSGEGGERSQLADESVMLDGDPCGAGVSILERDRLSIERIHGW